MVAGRRRERRLELVCQARLVWEIDQIDIDAFITTGVFGRPAPQRMPPERRARIDAKIDEYFRTGKLTVDLPGIVK